MDDALEAVKVHKVGVVDDGGFGGSFDFVSFAGVGGDDVLYFGGEVKAGGEFHAGEGVAEEFAGGGLDGHAVVAIFVFEEFSDVVEEAAGDEVVHVYGEAVAVNLGKDLGRADGGEGDAPNVVDKAGGTGVDEEGEGDVEEVVGGPAALFHGRFPGFEAFFTQVGVLDQVEFGYQFEQSWFFFHGVVSSLGDRPVAPTGCFSMVCRRATRPGRPAGRPYEVSRPYGMSTGRALVGHCIGGLWARCGAWDAGG